MITTKSPAKVKCLFGRVHRTTGIRVQQQIVRSIFVLEYEATNKFGERGFFIGDVRACNLQEAKMVLIQYLRASDSVVNTFVRQYDYGKDRSWLDGDKKSSYRTEVLDIKSYCRKTLESLRDEAAKARGRSYL